MLSLPTIPFSRSWPGVQSRSASPNPKQTKSPCLATMKFDALAVAAKRAPNKSTALLIEFRLEIFLHFYDKRRVFRVRLWVFLCLIKWSEQENLLSHKSQMSGLIPLCDRLWRVSSPDLVNLQLHPFHEQATGFFLQYGVVYALSATSYCVRKERTSEASSFHTDKASR